MTASSTAEDLSGEYMTAKEVAEAYNVTVITVYRWVKKRRLTPSRTPGNEMRFSRQDVYGSMKEDNNDGT